MHAATAPPEPSATPALCLVGEGGDRHFGLTTRQRLIRQFASAGVGRIVDAETAAGYNGPVIFVNADAVIDQPLIAILASRRSLLLREEDALGARPLAVCARGADAKTALAALAGDSTAATDLKLIQRQPSSLDAAYWKALRKREIPYAINAGAMARDKLEWRMFMATYKGATDIVTKFVWPRPAFWVTRALAQAGISPNLVTAVSALCVLAALWLFLEGHFALGLLAAWLMTFLDTVDGKLARTTLTASKWGGVFDHGIDLLHPPFWYIAWGYGLKAAGFDWSQSFLWTVLAVIFAGYVIQRLMEGAAIQWLGMEIHIWRKIDTAFRHVTARRNPNLILLTLSLLIGRPDLGLIAVAAWTVICLVLHGLQLAHGFLVKARDGELTSWMRAPVRRQ